MPFSWVCLEALMKFSDGNVEKHIVVTLPTIAT